MSSDIIVELHVPDFTTVKDYYLKLGFEVVWEREPEDEKGYLVLRHGANVICFWAGNDLAYQQGYFKQFPPSTPRGYAVELVIMIDGIEAYYESVKDVANVVAPLQLREWGVTDFRVADPHGFYLRFSEKHDVSDPRHAVE